MGFVQLISTFAEVRLAIFTYIYVTIDKEGRADTIKKKEMDIRLLSERECQRDANCNLKQLLYLYICLFL